MNKEELSKEAFYDVTLWRVYRSKKLLILYVQFDNGTVYGGVRYTNTSEEKEIMMSIINGALNGFIKPCGMQEIEHHRSLGRKVENVGKVRIKFEKEV